MKIDINKIKKYSLSEEQYINEQLNEWIAKNKKKWIVLDDDPTGVQTVHDVSVFTHWTYENIRRGFEEKNNLFFILTNSRGMTAQQSKNIHEIIAENVEKAAADMGREYLFISRSDSTLRGHYPLETEILREKWETFNNKTMDGEILCPFFPEGGRYTIGDVHYVRYGNDFVPAGETEFAKDKTFGYTASDLKSYIEEKTVGTYRADNVVSIALESLRNMEIQQITRQLMDVHDFNKVVVNALDYTDIKVFCIALYKAMAQGKNFIFRTAAGFVKAVCGVTDQPLLKREDLMGEKHQHGGVFVVGSHTKKTTRQLERLKELPNIESIAFNSDLVLDSRAFEEEIHRVLDLEQKLLEAGKNVVIYTKRKELILDEDTSEAALMRSVKISDGVQRLIRDLKVQPAFIVAKGGITSSDIGIKALGVQCARVMGQIKPGIPVWKTDIESRFPGIPYIIFPGNVGDDDTLKDVGAILMG